MSIVNQREIVGRYHLVRQALRSALRQDPDVILVGEMRDFETVETALNAAETGHVVFSTLHTLDATETINRIIAVFPPHQQRQVRIQLSSVLKAVVSQRLMPRADGPGRVPAVEVMVAHAVHPRLHRRQGSHRLIHGAIAAGTSQYGMQSFDQSIFSLYEQGLVTLDEALRWATQRRRVQAEGAGNRHDGGTGARRDGQERRRRARPGGLPVRWLTALRLPRRPPFAGATRALGCRVPVPARAATEHSEAMRSTQLSPG